MLYYSSENEKQDFKEDALFEVLENFINNISKKRRLDKVMVIPPDFTRFHSRAGKITQYLYKILGSKLKLVMPALGTHYGMTDEEKTLMFPGIPLEIIKDHDYKNDVIELGRIDRNKVADISGGAVDYDWPVQVNRCLLSENWDLIISVGQVVPHEVAGMANFTKNILVGLGGKECIDKSHFVGACCNLEKIMGRINNPVRTLLNFGSEQYLKNIPIVYIHTVVAPDMKGGTLFKGLFIGDDEECYLKAAELARETNVFLMEEQPDKIVVFLDEEEYKSTWVGNKSIYRTRLALADNAELVIIAPGLRTFGENPIADKLIRKYGYSGISLIKKMVKENEDLSSNLGAASHLMHGSTEGRFKVTYCPGFLKPEEIQSVGYDYGDIKEYKKRYCLDKLQDGWNDVQGERVFYISNPGLGLWAYRANFDV